MKPVTLSGDSIRHKVGLPPGSLVHVGAETAEKTVVSVVDYNREGIGEEGVKSLENIAKYKETDSVTWIMVDGLLNAEIIESIGETFNIHKLVLEDILNTFQRPKFEDYDDYFYAVLKNPGAVNDQLNISYEQISILCFYNVVITFRERHDSFFDPLKKRIKYGKSRFRNGGTDYLVYTIIDLIVDNYFLLTNFLDTEITNIEDNLLSDDSKKETLHTILKLKKEIINIKKYVSPTRELMSGLLHSESELIKEKTYKYLQDVSDHVLRVIEFIEAYREMLSGLLEIYLSNMSNRMNEIMKVLTVFASIFIPLTFLAGIYGMNFEYMPELKWKWSYPFIWGVFITIPVFLFIYFKRKKWL